VYYKHRLIGVQYEYYLQIRPVQRLTGHVKLLVSDPSWIRRTRVVDQILRFARTHAMIGNVIDIPIVPSGSVSLQIIVYNKILGGKHLQHHP
jgi:hypothetical protein